MKTKPPGGLGRLYAPDDRDRFYPLRSAIPDVRKLPLSKYWWAGPTLDQEQTPQCVGYSWRGFLDCEPLKTRTGPKPLQIYNEAQKLDEWPGEAYDGTSVRAGVKALVARGHIQQYLWAFDARTAKEFVLLSGPVVLGTNWYESMFWPDAEGYLNLSGPIAGGHAYLLVGYSTARQAFRLLNSWGLDWGQNGRAWILERDVDRLIREYGEAVGAVEQKVVTALPVLTSSSSPPKKKNSRPSR